MPAAERDNRDNQREAVLRFMIPFETALPNSLSIVLNWVETDSELPSPIA